MVLKPLENIPSETSQKNPILTRAHGRKIRSKERISLNVGSYLTSLRSLGRSIHEIEGILGTYPLVTIIFQGRLGFGSVYLSNAESLDPYYYPVAAFLYHQAFRSTKKSTFLWIVRRK